MSNVDLDRLDALFAKATSGEWFVQNGHRHREQTCAALHDGKGRVICDTLNAEDTMIFEEPDEGSVYYVEGSRVNDLQFCAEVHNDFPALAAELRTLRARVAELERKGGE